LLVLIGVKAKGEDAVLLTLHVTPRAGKTCFAGATENALRLRVKAPPVEGAANAECIRFLAKTFGVPKGSVQLVRGHKSREKTFELEAFRKNKPLR